MILCKVMTAKKDEMYMYLNGDGTCLIEVYKGKRNKARTNKMYTVGTLTEAKGWEELQAKVTYDCLIGLGDM